MLNPGFFAIMARFKYRNHALIRRKSLDGSWGLGYDNIKTMRG
jgi:hypothetical protein